MNALNMIYLLAFHSRLYFLYVSNVQTTEQTVQNNAIFIIICNLRINTFFIKFR
jgi:hypothetical protein